MSRWVKVLIGIVITVGLLWWALADVSIAEVVAQVRTGRLGLLAAAAGLATLSFGIRALRWRVLLQPILPDAPLSSRLAAVAVHFMANNVLVLRVGEFARAWVFARLEPVKASAVFGTVVVERFMDGVVLLLFLVLPLLSPDFPQVAALTEGWGAVLLKGAVLGVLLVLAGLVATAFFPRAFVRFAEAVAPFFPKRVADVLLHSLESFLESLAIVRDPVLLMKGFAWTFFLWAFHALSFWLGMLAFGIDTGYVSALFTSSVVAFGVALPSAPGFVGTFHAAAAFALTDIYSVGDAPALAFAFGYHFAGWLPITTIGLVYVWRLGLSLSDVGAANTRVETPAVTPPS